MAVEPNWSSQKRDFLSQLFEPNSINHEYFKHLYDFTKFILAEHDIPIELISSYRQSSFVHHRKDESAIFFDIGQSLLLKNVFKKISEGSGFSSITEIYKQSACLFIVEENYDDASFVFRHPIIPFTNYYLVAESELQKHGTFMSQYSEVLKTSFFNLLIDYFIVGHEIFHYLKFRKLIDGEIDKQSSNLFDYALHQCCYEQQDNFEEIATYYGQIEISQDGLEKIRIDLANRRIHYQSSKERLLEEIECDWFSFELLASFFFKNQVQSVSAKKDFCSLFYLLFSFFDLQFAVNKRFLLSTKSSISDLKPADIADVNLRKVALIQAMWKYIYNTELLENQFNKIDIETLQNNFQNDIFQLKSAVDTLYLMPTTLAIKDILINTEKLRDTIPKKQVQEFHIKSLVERIIGRDEVFNLQDNDYVFVS